MCGHSDTVYKRLRVLSDNPRMAKICAICGIVLEEYKRVLDEDELEHLQYLDHMIENLQDQRQKLVRK